MKFILLPAFLGLLTVEFIPEPFTLTLAALGLLGIGWRRRKRA
ncbi:MAG: PEP-CTERM sorting domain-containing protein [Planctomycetes bacterium]|nr:PEP-CTERM sorting domain-containing protein [Planctomycetota bacterium]